MPARVDPATTSTALGETEAPKPKKSKSRSGDADSSDSDSDSPDPPALERGREPHYFESEAVKIIVGKKKKQRTFYVHHGLITNSKFFEACLDSGFKESGTGTVTLKDDDPEAVEHFIKWLYVRKMSDLTEEISKKFAIFYSFADMICNEAYCNDLIDAKRAYDKTKNRYPKFVRINVLYTLGLRKTPYATYAMKSLVHQMLTNPAHFGSCNDPAAIKHQDATLAFQDMINEIIEYQKAPYKSPRSLKGCHFHCHNDGSTCSAMRDAKAAEIEIAGDTNTQEA